MTVLTPSSQRQLLRRVPSSLLDAAIATIPFTLVYVLHRPTYLSPWFQVGLPFAIFVAARMLALLIWGRLFEVSWDREGIRIRQSQDVASIPWSEYAGHRLTWGLPGRLRIDRASDQDPVTLDIVGLDDDQRDALLRELAQHPMALSNQRLKLTPRVD